MNSLLPPPSRVSIHSHGESWKRLLLIAAASCSWLIPADLEAYHKDLAISGTAAVNVVVKPGASSRVVAAANDLATKLSSITGGTFSVVTGDGSQGIALGVATDFSSSAWPYGSGYFDFSNPRRAEDYAIRSHADGVFIGGASESAVEHAVADLLHRFGYRLFFPGYHHPAGPTGPIAYDWEVIPDLPTLGIDIDIDEAPDYHARSIWYGYGDWNFNSTATAQWQKMNRLGAGMQINSGHAFTTIINRNLAAFNANPDYLALVSGNRVSPTAGNAKFCISNAGLRSLVVADYLARFAANPALLSLSIEPSDGGGWCECAGCAALGSRTDQLVTLANEVATAVDAVYPGQKYIGFYAYNEHCAPPTLSLHPQVIPLVATGFTPGWNTNTLMSGWGSAASAIGVREYYAVTTSDRDQPGKAKAANPAKLRDTIHSFHNTHGASFMSAESSNSFGPHGLGYYLASRYLWNTADTTNHSALINDFLTKAFGPAATVMGEFYQLIDGANRPLISSDLIHRMYAKCNAGLALTTDPKIRRRINQLALYTRYIELFRAYNTAVEAERQLPFEELMKFTYRIRKSMMVHSYGLWRDIPLRDKKNLTVPNHCKFNMPATSSDPANPWKIDAEPTEAEVAAIIANGLANNETFTFTPVSYSRDLIPPTGFTMPTTTYGQISFMRGTPIWAYVWNPSLTASKTFTFSGKYNFSYSNRTVYFTLSTSGLDEIEQDEVVLPPISGREVPYGTQTLTTDTYGLHQIEVNDAGSVFSMNLSPSYDYFTFEVSMERATGFRGANILYFYVPKGTTVVGGYAPSGVGDTMRDSSNTVRYTFNVNGEYFAVPVPAGQDGKFWRFQSTRMEKILLTVPPYVARHPRELLLPREVVEADAP